MNAQEVFNEAYKGIIKQGKPALSESNSICVYETEGGLHCGVGVLMTKKEIEVYGTFEGSVDAIVGRDRNRSGGPVLRPFFKAYVLLLGDIQEAHDDAAGEPNFVEVFKKNMAAIAGHHNLEVPE